MTRLVSAAVAKKQINTSMSDTDLEGIIDRVEAEITAKIGAPWADDSTPSEFTCTMRGNGVSLFLPTGIYEVASIVEDGTTLTSDDYRVWGNGGVIDRLYCGTWGDVCAVTYKPVDDRFKRIPAIIDMVRLTLERTAMQSESVAGEYSFTAPESWDDEYRKVMKRLMFKAV